MRLSHLLLRTLREASADAALPGYQLLLRAGYVRAPSPGSHAFLPLGVEVRARVEDRARRMVRDLGGQEVDLPSIQPTDLNSVPLAAASAQLAGERHRNWLLSGSHEGYLLASVSHVIQSYRQLPVLLYQIWQPFQVDVRPARGLFGSRETRVMDVWSLHPTDADLHDLYVRLLDELSGLIEAAGLQAYRVVGNADAAGRATAHRLIWPSPAGEEEFVACQACGYASDRAIARAGKPVAPEEPMGRLQEVETPGCRTIADLCAFLDVPPSRTAKALFLVAGGESAGERLVFAVVRGDTDVSEAKLRRLLDAETVRPATEDEIRAAGAEPGYGSPVGLVGPTVVVDDLIPRSPNLVAGANRPGYHLLNVNYGRDYQSAVVADITLACDGDACPACGAALVVRRGIELAMAANVGVTSSRASGALYLDQSGETHPIVLSCYRLYVDRLIAAVCEVHRDEMGLVWPRALAPYDVYLMTLGKRSPVVEATADSLYADLSAAGARVLYDDRDERAGVKFNDADLLGFGLRVAVGERGIAGGVVEVKHRGSGEVVAVPVAELVAYVGSLL